MYVRSRKWSTAIGKEADDRSASDLFQMQWLYGTEGETNGPNWTEPADQSG